MRLKLRGPLDDKDRRELATAFASYLDGLGALASPGLFHEAARVWFREQGWEVDGFSIEQMNNEDATIDVRVHRCRPWLPCPRCKQLNSIKVGDYLCDQCRSAMPS